MKEVYQKMNLVSRNFGLLVNLLDHTLLSYKSLLAAFTLYEAFIRARNIGVTLLGSIRSVANSIQSSDTFVDSYKLNPNL